MGRGRGREREGEDKRRGAREEGREEEGKGQICRTNFKLLPTRLDYN